MLLALFLDSVAHTVPKETPLKIKHDGEFHSAPVKVCTIPQLTLMVKIISETQPLVIVFNLFTVKPLLSVLFRHMLKKINPLKLIIHNPVHYSSFSTLQSSS